MTVRQLGRELGADPTAIYRHFSDKDALVRAAIDRMHGQANARMPTQADWRDVLRAAARLTLETMLAYPAFGALAVTLTTGGDNELAAVELLLGAFRDAGLSDADAVRYYATFSSYVLAFSSAQAGSLLTDDAPGEDSRWVADYSEVDPETFPSVAALHHELDALRDSDVYLTGIEIILESAALRVSAATG